MERPRGRWGRRGIPRREEACPEQLDAVTHSEGQSGLTSGYEHAPNNAQTKAGVLGWAEDADGVRHILQLRSRCEPDDRDVPGDASSLLLTVLHDDQIPDFTHSGPQNRGLDSQRPEGVDPHTATSFVWHDAQFTSRENPASPQPPLSPRRAPRADLSCP